MTGVLIDITGKQFGRLTALRRVEDDAHGLTQWRCVCSCGKEVTVRSQDLRRGEQKSCGCLASELTAGRNFRHGLTGSRLYRVWKNMKSRCYNPRVASYKDYGGRGITVCDEWLNNPKAFHDWALANGYSDEKSIDRIDVNGPYAPDNCRWATRKEQNRNQRTNHLIRTPWGLLCMREASERSGVPLATIKQRIKRGVPEDQLLTRRGERHASET